MTTLAHEIEYVTVTVGGQMFGLPITRVLDVFGIDRLTRIPLAPEEIAGVLNLRGRIVTAVDMRRRLGMPPRGKGGKVMAAGVEYRDEFYGLLVDAVGDVLKVSASSRDANPANLDPSLARVANGVHRLEDRLMVVLDVDRVLDLEAKDLAA